ncbi:aldo/keto reductase [Deinococcus misasensis]|uniref:aldo/keto reductase n=1 Tax=Deinococcus misasensis TaxID=392413 RepID=UPI00054D23FE|nr:aldo/keto reductase [Deinococcus misasensis]
MHQTGNIKTDSVIHASNSGTFAIGKTLQVFRLGFGAMRLTGKGVWGEPQDPENALRVLRHALDLGIDFIDTAEAYGPGVSEEQIFKALHPYPRGLVIATKGGHTRQGPDQWTALGRPEYLRQNVEMSLRRLKVDTIDLWQLHRIDPKVPRDEQFGAIKEMQQEGKIRFFGLSEVSIEEIEAAQQVLEVVTVQNRYNLLDRKSEAVLRYCEAHNIGFIPWHPLNVGNLAGAGGVLDEIAQRLQATPSQVALAWLLKRSRVMLPIPGTSSIQHLEENMAAASLELTVQDMEALEKLA